MYLLCVFVVLVSKSLNSRLDKCECFVENNSIEFRLIFGGGGGCGGKVEKGEQREALAFKIDRK